MKTFFARHVARILLAIIALASPVVARAALVTYTVTITNTPLPGAGTNLTVNGITRNWTNAASATGIQTNSAGVSASATNLFKSWASFPQVGVTVYQTATNVVQFRGLDITLSQGGIWASVSSSSSPSTNTTAMQLPLSAAYVSQLWTNIDELSTNRNRARLNLTAGLGLHGLGLIATNYTLTTNDLYVGVDTRSNTNLILTLPSAASASNLLFVIKDEGGSGATNIVKIYPASGDRLDTLLTNLTISNNFGGAVIRSRGSTNWAIIATGGGVTGGIASSGGGVPLTNSVWVSKNGSDSTGERGDPAKAFLTLRGAWTNAVSGDTIFVMPGTYDETDLLKDGVDWYFSDGAKVIYTGSASSSIFNDDSGALTSSISGDGEFTWSGSGGQSVVAIGSDSSNVRIHAKTISVSGTADYPVFVFGTVTIEDCTITSPTNTPVQIWGKSATTLSRCRLVMTGTGDNGAAIVFNNSANTNALLRDCVLIGNPSASSPVVMKATTPALLRIDGGLMVNLAVDSSVTLVTSEDRWYAGGIPYNDVVSLATNTAPFTIDATDFVLDTNYTNGTQRAHVSAYILLTANGADTAQVALYLDQDADTSFEQTGRTITMQGLVTNTVALDAWLQPGAIFIFTNLSTGSATATVNAGSSQWVKQ